jgi:hypothetical protein
MLGCAVRIFAFMMAAPVTQSIPVLFSSIIFHHNFSDADDEAVVYIELAMTVIINTD